jgi:hypothetical protein
MASVDVYLETSIWTHLSGHTPRDGKLSVPAEYVLPQLSSVAGSSTRVMTAMPAINSIGIARIDSFSFSSNAMLPIRKEMIKCLSLCHLSLCHRKEGKTV